MSISTKPAFPKRQISVEYLTINNGLPRNNLFRFQGNVVKINRIREGMSNVFATVFSPFVLRNKEMALFVSAIYYQSYAGLKVKLSVSRKAIKRGWEKQQLGLTVNDNFEFYEIKRKHFYFDAYWFTKPK
jgi:hypothetical protein